MRGWYRGSWYRFRIVAGFVLWFSCIVYDRWVDLVFCIKIIRFMLGIFSVGFLRAFLEDIDRDDVRGVLLSFEFGI